MLEVTALIIGTVTTSLIALSVFIKNRHSLTNKLLIGLAIGLVGWSLTNYFSLNTASDDQTLFWIRWIMFFVVIQNTCFFLLVRVFPEYSSDIFKRKKYKMAIAFSILTALTAVSPFLFVGFEDDAPVPGPGMALFLPHALIFALGGLVALIIRHHRARGVKKVQLQYFLAGTLLMFTLVPVSNFIVPVVFKNNQMVMLSPLYPIIFSGLIAFAIIRHRMFDIRSAVARTLAYAMSLASIAAIYALTVFIAIEYYLLNSSDVIVQRGFYIGFALVTGLFLQPVKRFFDRLTNKLFYQDAYDGQVLIDHLNRVLVTNVDLDAMLTKSAQLIEESIKAQYCVFGLKKTAYMPRRIIGSTSKAFKEEDIAFMRSATPYMRDKIIVTDELTDEKFKQLHEVLSSNDVAVVARLTTTPQYEIEGTGYLVLGPKKSGAPYTTQDKKVIRIIANELVIAVQNALRFEEIEKFNITLQEKIDDATRQLRKTNERLKALDETKDEFISMASHQLRTPLTSVKGYLSMVLEEDAGKLNKLQRKFLDQAFVSSQRMAYLIADLLNVSRLRTGKFVIDSIPAHLDEVVESEVNQLKETAEAKGLRLTYEKPLDFPMLMVDETKIRQVIMNFIDNAIYYTPNGGHIEVSLHDTGESIEFKVTDDGLGVPKSEQPHLFTKFYRAGNAKKARPDGTGLGLFMAKKVVIAQGGSIIFRSQEGKGSTFGFSFSKAKLQVANAKLQEPDSEPATATVA